MSKTWRTAAVVFGLAIGAAGAALAAAPSYRVIDKIPGPDGGWDYARVNPKTDRLMVTRGSSVMLVDLASRKVTPGFAPGAREHIALPVDGGSQVLVTNGGDNTALFVDANTGATLATVPVGKGPDSAAVDPRSGLALVMDHAGGEVSLIDPRSHKPAGTIEVGGVLEEVAPDGAGRAFAAVESKHELAVLDLAGRKVTAHIPLPGCDGPSGLAYNPQDHLVIAACDGATAIVDARTEKVQQMLPTGKGADGAVYDEKRHLAFIPAGRDGTLSVIAFDHGQARIAQTVETQKGARTIALDERTGRIYLPSATYVLAAGGGRPSVVPGSFNVIVVAP